MSILLRDVIDIPEQVGSDDYVLKLTSSTGDDDHIRATIEEYVLTESLRENFATALTLVADAVSKNTSRAAYLVGSFGSGKSHFMAVLYALLGNHPAMRTAKFNELTGRYDSKLSGKKILRLTYHLLGAKSLEQAVFQGYVDQIRRLHPEAELPAVHVSDSLLDDAENLRSRLGDEKFLSSLGSGVQDAWGGVLGGGAWDLPRYEKARTAPPEDAERIALVSALVQTHYSSFTQHAEYVDLDRGLVVISEHAKSLGYDATVLFLDELILWLAFSVSDTEFFARESQKITKLVESSGTQRPIPLISFISRQMDLRKWFADAGASGAEQEAIDRSLNYQQGRFREIELGDDNLAEVAHARLLRPKDDNARQILADAFKSVSRTPDVWDVLRDSMNTSDEHRGASEREFELTYPFSPALVATLRNLSTVMQRERTALKVMQRMLVERRDTLTVDDLIPVGDAFDRIVEGNEPIDAHAGTLFKAASELYRNKVLPMLLDKHQITADQLANEPASVPLGFRSHERIAKTLLLSAIAPKVPALRDITASRLAALNHGSIKTRLRGGEARVALGAVREWASKDIPEISVADGQDPIIRLQLAEVDYKSVIDRVRGEDNMGRRRVLLRKLVHSALAITSQDDLAGAATRTVYFRGSRREVDVVFGNVRDPASVPEQSFDPRPGTWRFIVDYPFDEHDFSAADDIARVDRLITGGDRHTVVWLPKFFSTKAMDDLAQLVKLDWLFTGSGDRWQENSDHLSAGDRAQARGILENLYRGSMTSFELLLRQAYGIEAADPKNFVDDAGHTEVLVSLSRDFQPRLPAALGLLDAFEKVVDQAFSATYPAHPQFEPATEEISARQFETVRGYVEQACTHRDGRVPTMPGTDRKTVRRVAGPLRVGKATEDHFLFGEDTFAFWAGELDRAAGESASGSAVTVGDLQRRIDAISPAWGLRPEARDLVVSAWALLRKRAWFEAGAPVTAPPLGRMRESIELRAEELPEQSAWDTARTRASELFGYTMPRTYLTGANVADFAQQVRVRAAEKHSDLVELIQQLTAAHDRLHFTAERNDRLTAATELANALERVQATAGNVAVIDQLAELTLPVAMSTAGQIRAEAGRDARALRGFRWQVLEKLQAGAEASGPAADSARDLLRRLRETISVPGKSLAEELGHCEDRIFNWVMAQTPTPVEDPVRDSTPPPPTDPKPPHPEPAPVSSETNPETVILQGLDDVEEFTNELRAAFARHGSRVRVKWWVE
ncbi:DUF6079 family protein [Nocardia sp. NPDC049737]|uniref:DUF6079 family protein n=1 Tax=Nocardia sp. NPDC049737 TaxID=3154358 RepID=UPI003437E70C